MTEYSLDEAKELIGSNLPRGGIPAAWWITTDQTQLDAYDRYRTDYDAHIDKIDELAQTIDLTVEDALIWKGAGRTELIGFDASPARQLLPVPAGWRLDRKQDRFVPSRKTKADREGPVVRHFVAVKDVPNIAAYITGLPKEIYLDDRPFGGTVYWFQFRRGDKCVMAFIGGDPDRAPEARRNGEIDTDIWHRQKLSVLLAMREDAA